MCVDVLHDGDLPIGNGANVIDTIIFSDQYDLTYHAIAPLSDTFIINDVFTTKATLNIQKPSRMLHLTSVPYSKRPEVCNS